MKTGPLDATMQYRFWTNSGTERVAERESVCVREREGEEQILLQGHLHMLVPSHPTDWQ